MVQGSQERCRGCLELIHCCVISLYAKQINIVLSRFLQQFWSAAEWQALPVYQSLALFALSFMHHHTLRGSASAQGIVSLPPILATAALFYLMCPSSFSIQLSCFEVSTLVTDKNSFVTLAALHYVKIDQAGQVSSQSAPTSSQHQQAVSTDKQGD